MLPTKVSWLKKLVREYPAMLNIPVSWCVCQSAQVKLFLGCCLLSEAIVHLSNFTELKDTHLDR